jgi:hypothetical protein
MRSKTAIRILSETSKETKQKAKDYADGLINKKSNFDKLENILYKLTDKNK